MSLQIPEGTYYSQYDGSGGGLVTAQNSGLDQKERASVDQIPTVRPADFYSPDPEIRRKYEETVMNALTDIGFVFVETPEIFTSLPEVYDASKAFFDLPEEVKLTYARPDIHYQRGYTPLREETSIFCLHRGPNKSRLPDEKENLFFGPDLPEDHHLRKAFPDLYAANIWPKEVPQLQRLVPQIRQQLFDVGLQILKVVEKARHYPDGYFAEMTKDSATLLRLLHYPPLTQEAIDEGRPWGCEHTDINLLTVLPASTKKGLQVRRRDKVWIPGTAPANHSLVQVGDMLQYLTSGELLSANHKVDAPTTPTTEGRRSMALFIHPAGNKILQGDRPITRSGQRAYPPITAAEQLMKRLKIIGLASSGIEVAGKRVGY